MNKEWTIDIFTRNLKYYMKKFDKTQKEMASLVGVSAPTFHDWLNGNKMPRMKNVQKLADCFGIALSDLIEDKEPKELSMTGPRAELISKLSDLDDSQIELLNQMVDNMKK